MDYNSSTGLQQFKSHVAIKFQLYNSLFTSLPFHRIEKTGILLSLMLEKCSDGYKSNQSPVQIIEDFFIKYTSYEKEQEKLDMLFRFIQFVERQVVLFDALEEAAFKEVNDINGVGTLKQLEAEIIQTSSEAKLAEKLKDFSVRLVLTAHPTQFYPGAVLGIINDLTKALADNNANLVNMYLQQLGKTPFLNKEKPTPLDEAVSLVWFLENVFYAAAGRMVSFIERQFPNAVSENNPIFTMGFWPGGDRDGNPNVNTGITLKVAEQLRGSIIKCYYLDVRRLKRRLTFKGVDTILADLERQLYNNIFIPGQRTELTKEKILSTLKEVKEIVIYQHNGLFLSLVENLINKVHVFGLHFASLDIRQESSVHNTLLEAIALQEDILPKNYAQLTEQEKIEIVTHVHSTANADLYTEHLLHDTLLSVGAVKTIQQFNGIEGCHRYVISQCNSALNVLEVFGIFMLGGWKKEELTVDIVPLFETIVDLKNAPGIMAALYENEVYNTHLNRRNRRQTIMLGFSDGTKDGGYLMANWSIYKAKKELTRISKEHGFDVVFFDGRGGPPARGGGKSHKFYASMGKDISNKEIQLTIQGQTISSSFGNIDSAQYNIEQLVNAGISNELFPAKQKTLTEEEEALIDALSGISFDSYVELKNHPEFMNYLSNVSPLKFYSDTNIGSRPTRRGTTSQLTIKDLRAIPFVGSWSQLKQNVTGYYGVGTALREMDKKGRFNEVRDLYNSSLFVKTLIDNCEMSMKKCFFPLTKFLANDPRYGGIWNMIYNEYELTQKYLFMLSGKNELMANYPVEQLSVQMREKIVLPLTTIQQFAMAKIREMDERLLPEERKEAYRKLVIRCSFGIINAGRNSA